MSRIHRLLQVNQRLDRLHARLEALGGQLEVGLQGLGKEVRSGNTALLAGLMAAKARLIKGQERMAVALQRLEQGEANGQMQKEMKKQIEGLAQALEDIKTGMASPSAASLQTIKDELLSQITACR